MRLVRWALVAGLALVPALAPVALADTTVVAENSSDDSKTKSGEARASNTTGAQVGAEGGGQEDVDNELDSSQVAVASTGSGVTGQVIGAVVADGNLTIDASNVTVDSSVETGDAIAENTLAAFVGLILTGDPESEITQLDTDNEASADQTAEASTGDGVAGQVVAAVVTGGTTDAVLSNVSDDVDVETGVALFTNFQELFVGLFLEA